MITHKTPHKNMPVQDTKLTAEQALHAINTIRTNMSQQAILSQKQSTSASNIQSKTNNKTEIPAFTKNSIPSSAPVHINRKRILQYLITIPRETMHTILRNFPPQEAASLLTDITEQKQKLPQLNQLELVAFEQYFQEIIQKNKPFTGGMAIAKSMVHNATLTEEQRELILNKLDTREKLNQLITHFNETHVDYLIRILSSESSVVISTILSQLKPQKAAQIFDKLSSFDQVAITQRMAKVEQIDNTILRNILERLHNKILFAPKETDDILDGTAILVNILNRVDSNVEKNVLQQLEKNNSYIASQVRDAVYTMDIIFQLESSDLESILRSFTEHEIALFLKGKTNEIKQHIFQHMSNRRALLIQHEYDIIGPVHKDDVQDASNNFIGYIKNLVIYENLLVKKENESYI